jgi:hypothetical protein
MKGMQQSSKRFGPTCRAHSCSHCRARLVCTGKDVWEIIETVRDNDNDVAATTDIRGPYCGAYRDEIDELIADNEREAADVGDVGREHRVEEQLHRASAAWPLATRREQQLRQRAHADAWLSR